MATLHFGLTIVPAIWSGQLATFLYWSQTHMLRQRQQWKSIALIKLLW